MHATHKDQQLIILMYYNIEGRQEEKVQKNFHFIGSYLTLLYCSIVYVKETFCFQFIFLLLYLFSHFIFVYIFFVHSDLATRLWHLRIAMKSIKRYLQVNYGDIIAVR